MRPDVAARVEHAGELIRPLGRVLVAYSGGVDSTLVLFLAHRVLGDAATGVIARSPSLPQQELADAQAVAAAVGCSVNILDTGEVELEAYIRNEPDRCYHCKTELYGRLAGVARAAGATVLDGFNTDDRGDWRPGRRAAVELGVRSPLDEAGFDKATIRAAARELGLPNWDKPAAACLSSRIPFGIPVTTDALQRIESGEAALRAAGFSSVRVRDHSGHAVIEVDADEVGRLREPAVWAAACDSLVAVGYATAEIDPLGYRRGSLNADLLSAAR